LLAGERADAAGDVDDPRRGRSTQHRQHRVGDAHDADDVGLDDRQHGLGVDGGRRLLRPTGDARVVDQGVETTGLLLHQVGSGGDASVVGHVERYTEDVGPTRTQLLHRGLATRVVSGPDADLVAEGA